MALISLSEWIDRYSDADDEGVDVEPWLDFVLISDTELLPLPIAPFTHSGSLGGKDGKAAPARQAPMGVPSIGPMTPE